MPVANNQLGTSTYNVQGGFSQVCLPPEWRFPYSNAVLNTGEPHSQLPQKLSEGGPSSPMPIKAKSLKKRIRRAKKKEADEVARKRVSDGQKPYAVQVRPSRLIDSGCVGHLKWQEEIRNLTPRMLDTSIIKYEDQSQSSRDKLWESLRLEFEFLENQVTQVSFDKMVKTWLWRDCERIRKLHGHCVKAPPKFTDQ